MQPFLFLFLFFCAEYLKFRKVSNIFLCLAKGRRRTREEGMMSPIPGPEVPGEETHIGTALLEKVTATIQGFAPINRIHQHQCAAHFYAHDMSRQVVVHHFCAHLNEEIRQCLLYDSPDADARLIGVEYMVSENLFLMLPDEEKKLWHSHEYEVKSGGLVMPGVPGPIERLDLAKICKTYGKAFQFWQVDQGHDLPLGPPNLMMALTKDGQLDEQLAQSMEKCFGVSSEKERDRRAYMTGPQYGIHPLANGVGSGLKIKLRETSVQTAPQ